jgi:hypothetical protein
VIRHHTWWNYYQRGRLHLRDEKFEEAQSDFETALGLRPGARYPYAREHWRVRTYGMHVLEGYFPHRELAICLFKMNDHEGARKLLETSMRMEPSARAKFYLNQVHNQLALASAPPPVLEIGAFPQWTAHQSIELEGSALGSNEIATLSINATPEFIELANHRINFRQELRMKEGVNQIEVAATDVSGKTTVSNLIVTADWTPPEIHLERNGPMLSIICKDNMELHRLEMNGTAHHPMGRTHTIDCPIAETPFIQLSVSDPAGNRLDWSLSGKELEHLARQQEATPPQLRIANAGQTITLFNPEYELDIHAADDTALKRVELNGKNLLQHPTSLFRTLRRIPLTLGTNQLEVVAADYDGNLVGEHITVVRKRPEYLDRIYRLAVVHAPVSGEIPSPEFAQRLDRLAGYELTKDPVRFFLLATKEEDQILTSEHDLSDSALADPRALLNNGKKLNADLAFMTRVISDAPGQTIYTRVLDSDSGKELFVEDVYLENLNDLPRQVGGLVMKIEQRFPLLKASVHRLEKQLAIDAGSNSGVHQGMRFLVIRSTGPFSQGHVIQHNNLPTELMVSKVESETAQVIIPRGQSNGSVRSGDYVFTR